MSPVRFLLLVVGLALFAWDGRISSVEALGMFLVTVSFAVSEICEAIRESKQ